MRRRPGRDSDPLGVVGWVLADLMLILVIVFIGTQLGDPNAGLAEAAALPTATTTTSTTTTTAAPASTGPDESTTTAPTTTSTTTSTTTTTTTEPPPKPTTTTTTTTTTTLPPKGIESGYVCVVIPAVAELVVGQQVTITDVDKTLEQTRSKLERDDWPYRGRKLGMVLTWGIAPNDQRGQAIDLAEQFNQLVLVGLLDHADSGAEQIPSRNFWTGNGTPGSIKLDIYFVAEAGLPDSALVPPGNKPASTNPSKPGDCDVWEQPDD